MQWRRRDDDASRVGKTVTDVRDDSRVRLVLATATHVAVEFNGPLLQFVTRDPAVTHPSLLRLGPDALAARFAVANARRRPRARPTKSLADPLLDQTFVAGVGNKYKSEILFLQGLHPFQPTGDLGADVERALLADLRRTLRYGYAHAGRTRPLADGEINRWDTKHWVFRRGGRPRWRCGTRIVTDRSSSARVTFWCPTCQPKPVAMTQSARRPAARRTPAKRAAASSNADPTAPARPGK